MKTAVSNTQKSYDDVSSIFSLILYALFIFGCSYLTMREISLHEYLIRHRKHWTHDALQSVTLAFLLGTCFWVVEMY